MLRNVNTSEAENIVEMEDDVGRPELDKEFQTMLLDLSEILDNTTDIQNASDLTNASDTHLSETEINGILNELGSDLENSTQENNFDDILVVTTSTAFTSGTTTSTSTTSLPYVAVVPTINGSDPAVVTTPPAATTPTTTPKSTSTSTPEIKQKFGENPVEIDTSSSTVVTTAANTYVTGQLFLN